MLFNIGDNTIADAILDRVVHNAHRIELQGESLRKKGKTNPEKNLRILKFAQPLCKHT